MKDIIKAQRKLLLGEVLKRVRPLSWNSAYRKSTRTGSRPLRLWVALKPDGGAKAYRLPGFFTLSVLEGFSEDGVISDGYAGALVTHPWSSLPVEDLAKLLRWCERVLPRYEVKANAS